MPKAGMSEILGKVPIFQDLNDSELQTLETIVHPRTYGAGETIFVESEPGVGIAMVISMGVLSIWMTLPYISLMGAVIGIINLIEQFGT